MIDPDKLPEIGDVLKGRVVGFRNGDVVLAIGRGLLALMAKSDLVWLRRPAVGIKLKNGTELDVVVKAVSPSASRGAPYILVGHLRTDERPWDRARRRHPIGRRERRKVVESVPGGAIVAFESNFWAWLDDAERSSTEPERVPDRFRGEDGFDVVVHSFDHEKRRIRVRHPMGRPGPDAAGEEAEITSP